MSDSAHATLNLAWKKEGIGQLCEVITGSKCHSGVINIISARLASESGLKPLFGWFLSLRALDRPKEQSCNQTLANLQTCKKTEAVLMAVLMSIHYTLR